MRLEAIINAIQPDDVVDIRETEVLGVACHPDAANGPSMLFVCMDEYLEYNLWQTWRSHLEKLPALDLSVVVAPRPIPGLNIPQLVTREPRKALGQVARLLHGCPEKDLQILGVTGTNGKTTTTRLLAHLLSSMGQPCGSIGTLGVDVTDTIHHPGTYTTPLSPAMYADLAEMRDNGAKGVAMEVSSHGLALDRVEGLVFDGAILTNVERDHLDFHGTPEAYAEAKMRLFGKVKPGGKCVLNKESSYFDAFSTVASAEVVSFGRADTKADFRLLKKSLSPTASRFTIRDPECEWELESQLIGHFQVENILSAIAILRSMGHAPDALREALISFPPVCGRMEQIHLPNGCTAIVDYAHNPDGLKNLLIASRGICQGRLHVVFGCGGDRDKGKRSIMGELASNLADVCWVTSDNPRTEDPLSIIEDVLKGMPIAKSAIHVEPDRAQAILSAYANTEPEDVLIIAGKGHEDYQIVGLEKHHFSDQEILRRL